MQDYDELWTKREVADFLSCSPSTIDRLRADGSLVAHKMGTRVKFKRGDVTAFVESCRVQIKGEVENVKQ